MAGELVGKQQEKSTGWGGEGMKSIGNQHESAMTPCPLPTGAQPGLAGYLTVTSKLGNDIFQSFLDLNAQEFMTLYFPG